MAGLMDTNWLAILMTALFSSLFTLGIGAFLFLRFALPLLEQRMDRKTDDAVRRMEQLLRQRLAQGFAETVEALRDVLVGRAGSVARSTADIVGDSVRRMFDRLSAPIPPSSPASPRSTPGVDDSRSD